MLILAKASAWQHAPDSGRRSLEVPVAAGIAGLVLTARGWSTAQRSAQVCGPDCGEISLVQVRDFVVGVFSLPSRGGGKVMVATDRAPAVLTFRALTQDHGMTLCHSVLPASLLGFRREASTVRPIDLAGITASLEEGNLDGAVSEVALARLSGLDADAAVCAILCYLAERPLFRSRVLGALVAALYDQRETV